MRRAVLLAAIACKSPVQQETIHISAAISLKEPLEEIAKAYETRHPGTHVEIALGASGDLATQIERGAPAELFASAAEAPAMRLVEAGRGAVSCTIASNTLVLIHGTDPKLAGVNWTTLATTPAVTHVALGLTPSVPAGTYAEQALSQLGVLDSLAPKIVRGANVRQVLDLVARGEADAGFVYASDVRGRSDVVVVGEAPEAARPRIVYPLVVSPDATSAARDFAAELCSSQTVLERYGFRRP